MTTMDNVRASIQSIACCASEGEKGSQFSRTKGPEEKGIGGTSGKVNVKYAKVLLKGTGE